MAGHPLRAATDRRLGEPLPHQLAIQTRAHPIPPEFFTLSHARLCAYAVLAAGSSCYPPVWGRLPTRYSPVRHSVAASSARRLPSQRFVRLACVKHAASVHPEPGSNSQIKFFLQNLAWLVLNRSTVVFRFCSECSHSWPKPLSHFYKNFQGFTYCSVIKVLCCLSHATTT